MSVSDKDAVRAALSNPEVFSVIIERYQGALFRYIQRLGNVDADIAKDILQESFIKMYLNLNDYDDSLPFSSWIYRIVHNETMRHFRFMKHRPQAAREEDIETLFAMLPDELDILVESDNRLRGEKIAEALNTLPPKYREILLLRYYEDKSYEEISDILQIAPGTVATNIARGKAALRELLEQNRIID